MKIIPILLACLFISQTTLAHYQDHDLVKIDKILDQINDTESNLNLSDKKRVQSKSDLVIKRLKKEIKKFSSLSEKKKQKHINKKIKDIDKVAKKSLVIAKKMLKSPRRIKRLARRQGLSEQQVIDDLKFKISQYSPAKLKEIFVNQVEQAGGYEQFLKNSLHELQSTQTIRVESKEGRKIASELYTFTVVMMIIGVILFSAGVVYPIFSIIFGISAVFGYGVIALIILSAAVQALETGRI